MRPFPFTHFGHQQPQMVQQIDTITRLDPVDIASVVAMAVARRCRRVTPQEVLGAAWEGANAAAARLEESYTQAQRRRYLFAAAHNAAMKFLSREIGAATEEGRRPQPGPLPESFPVEDSHSGDVFSLLVAALDEAGVTDPNDRAAALMEWGGGADVQEARIVVERRLSRVRGKLRGVL